jgi:hypothetical protein
MGMRKKPVAVRQPDDNVLDLGDINRCNSTALRKATRRVSQLYDSGLGADRSALHATIDLAEYRALRKPDPGPAR